MSTTSEPFVAPAARRIPLWLKLAYTAFMAVLVPIYLRNYGPTNFLYFCDVALIITLVCIWIESPFLFSMCAVGIIASQTLWVIDFFSNLIGHPLTGLTDYMFMVDHSLFLRGLSLFHGWLPFLLVYLVWRLGYDWRALPAWTVVAWALLLISFFLMPPPRPDPGLTPVNIDYVWGFSDTEAQHWMPPGIWVAALMVVLPALLYVPAHFLLRRLMPKPVRAWCASALHRCPLLAQSGHSTTEFPCPLLGVKRTSGSQRRGYRLTISQPPGTHLKRVPESGRTDFIPTALTMVLIASSAIGSLAAA